MSDEILYLETRLYNLRFKPLAKGGVSPTLTVEMTGPERDLLAAALRALRASDHSER